MAVQRYAIALAIVPLIALGSWRFWHRDLPVPNVAIVQAQQGDLVSALTATGTIQARRTVDIKYDTQNLLAHLARISNFELHHANLWMSIVTRIHAGLDAVRTLWRCIPLG